MLRRHFPDRLAKLTLDELLAWLDFADNAVLNDLALELLETRGGLEKMPVEQWLKLIEDARPDLLDRICDMIARVGEAGAGDVRGRGAARDAAAGSARAARLRVPSGQEAANEDEVTAVFGLRERGGRTAPRRHGEVGDGRAERSGRTSSRCGCWSSSTVALRGRSRDRLGVAPDRRPRTRRRVPSGSGCWNRRTTTSGCG